METVSSDDLALQIRLAYMLQYIGAKYVSLRIFNNLKQAILKKNLNLLKISPHYYHYLTKLHLNIKNYIKTLESSKKAVETLRGEQKA